MKKLFILTAACMLMASCGTTSSLYYWGGVSNGATTYENLAYKTYDKQTPESTCALLVAYENMVKHPTGTRQVPPPGICAEYGYLLLQPETAATFEKSATDAQKRVFRSSDYGPFFKERGAEMMAKEIEYYPESAKFIAPLIKKFSN